MNTTKLTELNALRSRYQQQIQDFLVNDNKTKRKDYVQAFISYLNAEPLTFTEAETEISVPFDQEDQLMEQLQAFYKSVQRAYRIIFSTDDLPDWLKQGQKSYEVFYANFFEEATKLPPSLFDIIQNQYNMQLSSSQENYNNWLAIQNVKKTNQGLFQKLQHVYDTFSVMEAILRDYGVSNLDIQILKKTDSGFSKEELGIAGVPGL